MPKFSVVIPAYNAEATIARAVDCALNQTLRPHEVIVVDDGSHDGTADILRSYGDRIVLIQQDNRGVGAARNAAFDVATGDYAVFLDADDEWMSSRLEHMQAYLQRHPECDIVTTEAIVQDDQGRTSFYYRGGGKTFPPPRKQLEAILRRNFIFVGAAVRLSALRAIGGFDLAHTHQGEYEVWVRLIASGSRAGLIDEPLAIYHRGPGGLNADRVGIGQAIERVLMLTMQRHRLTTSELTAAEAQLLRVRRSYTVATARRALVAGSPEARQLARQVARDTTHPRLLRAKFALAALSPATARRLDSTRRDGTG